MEKSIIIFIHRKKIKILKIVAKQINFKKKKNASKYTITLIKEKRKRKRKKKLLS